MACRKSELIAAINSFGTARATGDSSLINFAANSILQLVETLAFEPEEDPVQESTAETGQEELT